MSDFRPGEIRMTGLGKRYWSRAGRAPSDDEFDDAEGDDGEDEGGEGRRFRLFSRTPRTELWALRDVTCTVEPGERVALIGANGAGKSTLVRILSRTLPPSEGLVEGCGIVVPFAALKSPLSRDASGCDNLRMLARLLRIPPDRLEERMDEIVAFSELGAMAKEKVARYSDRSFSRLSMAMGLLIEPDICLIDDGVKAGDELYRRKFDRRFEEMLERGTTLLYAGGNFGQLRRYCRRALLLQEGRVTADEALEPAIRRFLAAGEPVSAAAPQPLPVAPPPAAVQVPGSASGTVSAARLVPVSSWNRQVAQVGEAWRHALERWREQERANDKPPKARIVQARNDLGRLVGVSCLNSELRPVARVLPGEALAFDILVEACRRDVKIGLTLEIEAGPSLLLLAEPGAPLFAEAPGRFLFRAELGPSMLADTREEWAILMRASVTFDAPAAEAETATGSLSLRLRGDKRTRFDPRVSETPDQAPVAAEIAAVPPPRARLRPALAWTVFHVLPEAEPDENEDGGEPPLPLGLEAAS